MGFCDYRILKFSKLLILFPVDFSIHLLEKVVRIAMAKCLHVAPQSRKERKKNVFLISFTPESVFWSSKV